MQDDVTAGIEHLIASKIAPVPLMHGKLNERVLVSHARIIKRALAQHKKRVELVEFEDEGHGLFYIRNEKIFPEKVGTFLEKHFGKGASVPAYKRRRPGSAKPGRKKISAG